ncbi:MAG: M24 family metallopeptidase C-terminal domain-containing protein, partial [Lachnospiraceae bacterium]|nr:M24 family metallopeptidase C-terminal domain-containing protein [Lachnospiraceae bacterium]
PERKDSGVLEEGMCTTDEPGIYLEGKYGIRLENELICRKGAKKEYGQFMYFEDMTYVPFDLDLVEDKYLNAIDKERLNDYHKKVYETVSPYLTDDEKIWLKTYTRQI